MHLGIDSSGMTFAAGGYIQTLVSTLGAIFSNAAIDLSPIVVPRVF